MKKLHFFVVLLIAFVFANLVTACAASTPPATVTPLPSDTPTGSPGESSLITTTGGFFALSVADAEASANWYSEKLGLKIVMQPPKINQSTAIILEGGGLIVELIQHDEAQPLSIVAPTITDKMLVHGIVKAGVIVENFDQTVAILRERNVTIAFGPFPATAEQRANVIIQDNEGNFIQFFGK